MGAPMSYRLNVEDELDLEDVDDELNVEDELDLDVDDELDLDITTRY